MLKAKGVKGQRLLKRSQPQSTHQPPDPCSGVLSATLPLYPLSQVTRAQGRQERRVQVNAIRV